MPRFENDPTQGWAWDPQTESFMQPSLFSDDRWEMVRIPWDKAGDPVYQYDPHRHPLYQDARKARENRVQAERRSDARNEAIRYAYGHLKWKDKDAAQEQLNDFNRTYGLSSADAGYLYLDGEELKEQTEPIPVRQRTGNERSSPWYDNASLKNYSPESRIQQRQKQQGAKEKNPSMSGYFDGRMFTIRQEDGKVIYRQSYPAYSGKSDKDRVFDYSPERQMIPDQGPIPEGTYWINPQEIIYGPNKWSPKDIVNRALPFYNSLPGVRKRGIFSGGYPSWGAGKVEINPKQINIEGINRGGFTIHGGEMPGSRGCIDLTSQDKSFFEFLEKHRGTQDSIPIFVKYPKSEE